MPSATVRAESVECLPAGLRHVGASERPDPNYARSAEKLVFRAAAKSPEFADNLCAHYRETRRIMADIPCEISLLLSDGTLFDSGSAVVRNVSPSGALVTNIKLEKGCYPARPFKVTLLLKSEEHKGIGIEATPVRIAMEPAGLGVRFDEIFVNA